MMNSLHPASILRLFVQPSTPPSPSTPPASSIFDQWPPPYIEILSWRQQKLRQFSKNPDYLKAAKAFYALNPLQFILHWVDTYDPRNVSTNLPPSLPFILFPRQRLLITFFSHLLQNKRSGLVRKSRDMGATWAVAAFATHLWLFVPGSSVGIGSRKEVLVDHIGNMGSILEKIRQIIRRLPPQFLPPSPPFDPDTHLGYMRLINPTLDPVSTITGEAGVQLGRGDRKTIYFLDEAAHITRPEQTEGALDDTTNVRVDISTPSGVGNVFHRKYEAGTPFSDPAQLSTSNSSTLTFDLLWHHHPAKTPQWYAARRQKAQREGLLQKFREEIDADFFSSQDSPIIPYAWITAVLNAHSNPAFTPALKENLLKGPLTAGLDIADGGNDSNALAIRRGNTLIHIESWANEQDTAYSARRAIQTLSAFSSPASPVTVWYDVIGVGSGVKAEVNRLSEANHLPLHIRFRPWNAASSPRDPKKRVNQYDRDSPLNEDLFQNLKAQAWYSLRRRFESAHAHLTASDPRPPDELIAIGLTPALTSTILSQLAKELCQPTFGQSQSLRTLVNKTPEGTRSPNLADAMVMAFFPAELQTYTLDNL